MAWSNGGRAVSWAIALGWLAGCAGYRPQPLDSAAVAAALAPPKLEAVKIDAARLQHPLLQPLVIDGRDGFSPEEIALMVVIVSPQLRALRDQGGVARAQVVQAGILPNPQWSYALDRPRGNLDPTLVNAPTFGLSWEVTSLLARHDQVAAAKANAGAVDLAIAWQEWQVAQAARLRALRLGSLDQQLPLAREIEADLAENLARTQKALELGHRTGSDLTAAAQAWSQAQDVRFSLEKQLRAERLALNVSLGLPAEQKVRLKLAAEVSTGPAGGEASAAALLQGLEQRRLDLVALTLGYESQEATLRAAVRQQFPKIGLSLSKARDTSDIKTRGFGVTIDLPVFDRNQGPIAIGQATRQQLFDEYIARVAEARAEVVQLFDELAMTRAQVKVIDDSIPALEQLVAGFEKALQTRNADLSAFREARGALATRRMDRCQAQQGVFELEAALEIATGRPLLNRNPSR